MTLEKALIGIAFLLVWTWAGNVAWYVVLEILGATI
jgi:hypothetical protein